MPTAYENLCSDRLGESVEKVLLERLACQGFSIWQACKLFVGEQQVDVFCFVHSYGLGVVAFIRVTQSITPAKIQAFVLQHPNEVGQVHVAPDRNISVRGMLKRWM